MPVEHHAEARGTVLRLPSASRAQTPVPQSRERSTARANALRLCARRRRRRAVGVSRGQPYLSVCARSPEREARAAFLLCAQRIKMEGRSFGAGRAGVAFDPIAFVKQPQTIFRILSWIFSIVVFGSIVNEGYVNSGSERLHCIFNKNNDACNYGITIGVVAFLACTFFFVLDIHFPQISSVKDRKKAVLLEIGFSGFWTFLWFVGFCFLANQWQRTSPKELPLNQGADAARAAIAFSFFSIITWAALTVRAVQKYMLGTDMTLFATDHFDGNPTIQPYPTGSGMETTDTYQSPPFTENLESGSKGYQVPTY
ncbi:synaptogyrin-3-like [Scleropages formosus]|uniref:Synaptogyrin 3 n=1 Tax=Scleropages formosus TaxID=113540 RepID=A0A8C9RFD4_SCLFO|nr:synaptogyrin-3-like [Scleropages formosus]